MTKLIPIDVHKIDLYLSPINETATIRKLNVSDFDRLKSHLKRIIINSFRGHFMKMNSRLDFENLDSFFRDHPIYGNGRSNNGVELFFITIFNSRLGSKTFSPR